MNKLKRSKRRKDGMDERKLLKRKEGLNKDFQIFIEQHLIDK